MDKHDVLLTCVINTHTFAMSFLLSRLYINMILHELSFTINFLKSSSVNIIIIVSKTWEQAEFSFSQMISTVHFYSYL